MPNRQGHSVKVNAYKSEQDVAFWREKEPFSMAVMPTKRF